MDSNVAVPLPEAHELWVSIVQWGAQNITTFLVEQIWIGNLAPPFTSYVTLINLLNFSQLLFPHQLKGEKKISSTYLIDLSYWENTS